MHFECETTYRLLLLSVMLILYDIACNNLKNKNKQPKYVFQRWVQQLYDLRNHCEEYLIWH